MIGPGWMPSRPRPVAHRKLVLWRRRRIRRMPGDCSSAPVGHDGGAPAPLPTATLRAMPSQAWHRVAAGDLLRWLSDRWLWFRPRSVPIAVALVAALAISDAIKRLTLYARGDDIVRVDAVRPLPRHAALDDHAVMRVRPLLVPSISTPTARTSGDRD